MTNLILTAMLVALGAHAQEDPGPLALGDRVIDLRLNTAIVSGIEEGSRRVALSPEFGRLKLPSVATESADNLARTTGSAFGYRVGDYAIGDGYVFGKIVGLRPTGSLVLEVPRTGFREFPISALEPA